MGLKAELSAYAAARNRRFILAALLALAAPFASVLARRAAPPDDGGLIWAALLAAVGVGFTVYVLWDFHWRPRSRGHVCPQCRQPLVGYAERAAIDTGRCTKCKAEIT